MASASAIKKLFIYAGLAAVIFLAGRSVYFQMNKTCGNCGNQETSGEYFGIVIRYSKNNGSLPPAYYRENILTISTDGSGQISGEYVTMDYEKILEEVPVFVSSKQLNDIMLASSKSGRRTDGVGDPVCPGASIKSVEIFQRDTVLFDRSLASCGGAPSDAALTEVFKGLEELVP